MTHLRFLVIHCFGIVSIFAAQVPAERPTTPEPSLPVIDYKACPFEGCTFGKWIVVKDVELYSTWKEGRRAVATVKSGKVVKGLTGVHITYEPDQVQALVDLPELRLKAGETILRYMYHGEGFADIWAKGQWKKNYGSSFITETDGSGCLRECSAKVVSKGRKDWWVRVKTSSGVIGWAKVEGQFDCMDVFGGDDKCYDLNASEARAEAEANLGTPEGKAYSQQVGDEFNKKYVNTMHQCVEGASNKGEAFWILLKLQKDARVEEVLLQPTTKLGECMRETLYRDSFSPPPPAYWVGVYVKTPN